MATDSQAAASSAGPVDDGACFACGPFNPSSLGLRFEPVAGGGACGEVVLGSHLQGYRGVAHGGIVMLVLDEVMAHAAGYAGERVMTAAATVRFRAPVPLGVPLRVSGRVASRRGKILRIDAEIRAADGALLASSEGSFASLGPIDPARFGNFGARPAV